MFFKHAVVDVCEVQVINKYESICYDEVKYMNIWGNNFGFSFYSIY